MYLFNIKHESGIHMIMDVKKTRNTLELDTVTGEKLYIIAITDDRYTVYDDRFAGASKQLNSIEAFDMTSSFRSLDFDHMRQLFTSAFDQLLNTFATFVGKDSIVDLEAVKEQITEDIKGIHFKIVSDTNKPREFY